MIEPEEDRGAEHVSLQTNGFPENPLESCINGKHLTRKFRELSQDDDYNDGEEDIELGLGLSLNGQFGVDPKRAKSLTRSSSISNFMVSANDSSSNWASTDPGVDHAPLFRTCSLPTETEEDWRKRKELQTRRRMEAKRKRQEKLKNGRVVRCKVNSGDNFEENCRRPVIGHRGELPSQGSIGSQGSGSSGLSDLESQPTQGTNIYPDVKSPASVQSLPEQQIERKPKPTANISPSTTRTSDLLREKSAGAAVGDLSEKAAVSERKAKEELRSVLLEMPCVSATGDGPNGKRVEGFLYRYRKGEEVRIVCVCHGRFLSPAEFVKHAGGGDVKHPLKHIVVNPAPLF